jgi:flavin-binding protein dodecin
MSIAKVIEVIAEGKSLDNAIENAVKDSSKSVRNIKSVNIENIQATVEDGKIDKFRINAKVTFVVDD